jgi:para-nitrobenzyl esterase
MRREPGHRWHERFSWWLVFVCAMLVAIEAGAAGPSLVVAIESGKVEGVAVASLPHGGAFLGIPYAAQPVGDLRWRAPRAAGPWNGVRSAKAYGPACPQRPSPWLPEMLGRTEMATDEACLFLNVWTPELGHADKLPVLVWIHGGGNVEGSAEWPPLGETLAREGVVVVSINYRLGVFGFFSHPALSAESPQHVSGNYGQLDQVAALEWVKRNIEKFGGDPHRVTVAGASSGSLDICNLVASPLADGLMEGAILQSGVCVDSVFPAAKDAEKNGADFARRLSAGAASEEASLAALRAMPAGALLEAAAKDQDVDLEPSVDGWFLREQPAAAFAHGRQMKIPVLVGSNENEVSIFASPLVGGRSYRPKTIAEYRQWLERRFKENADGVFAAYPVGKDGEATAVFNTMDTDFDFGFGARLLASEMAGVQQRAYLYHFTYVGEGDFARLGAFHSEESMFLSQKFWTSWIHTPEDARLSAAIVGYWVSFVKTGNPNTRGLPVWPAYVPEKDLCQVLGKTIETTPVPRSNRFPVFQKRLNERLKGS